ncbi:DUF4265 domain-containing protein [Myroides pelagicus]|uniref:DUF4265 domain-containing protein n=1 Tax=Myroides pelagicus TaxID=270914 RepID=A0A7K1GP56_9FLAO|nr:DUF4265 domain-containing protein [Myroides pelagicus]MEC4113091.1 DUF4265 domain-containing protein [Myroides pelagicus]MTH29994.1 DUF4265 domain-containing protein [Myroides pelagicus]
MSEQLEQVVIKYYSEVLEKDTEEILWGVVIDTNKGLYRIDNIPYYGPELSCEDIVHATKQKNNDRPVVQYIETYSGNSTVQVIVQKDKYDRDDLYNEILYANTEIEVVDDYYFVINVPSQTDYKNVYAILSALEDEKVISFAEPMLSPKHQSDIR